MWEGSVVWTNLTLSFARCRQREERLMEWRDEEEQMTMRSMKVKAKSESTRRQLPSHGIFDFEFSVSCGWPERDSFFKITRRLALHTVTSTSYTQARLPQFCRYPSHWKSLFKILRRCPKNLLDRSRPILRSSSSSAGLMSMTFDSDSDEPWSGITGRAGRLVLCGQAAKAVASCEGRHAQPTS